MTTEAIQTTMEAIQNLPPDNTIDFFGYHMTIGKLIINIITSIATVIGAVIVIAKWALPMYKRSIQATVVEPIKKAKSDTEQRFEKKVDKLIKRMEEFELDLRKHKLEDRELIETAVTASKIGIDDRFHFIGKSMLKDDIITFDDFTNFRRIYKAYKDIGLNHDGDILFEKVERKYKFCEEE